MLFYLLSMIETEEDKSKFQLIYEKYKDLLLHIAWQEVHNEYDAEDIVSKTFIKVIKYLDKIENPVCNKTKNTLALMTRRTIADFFKKKKKQKIVFLEDEEIELASDVNIEKFAEASDISRAIAMLSPKYRDLLLLKYDSGFDDYEIAKEYQMTVTNVRRTILRAKRKLESILADMEVTVL